ncbi:MAG: hypothetical protein U0531_07835 [Dehalococcoidia bacterium]
MDEYYRMAAAGILRPDERVELIEGEIVVMAPISSLHAACVTKGGRTFALRLGDRVQVRLQNPVRLLTLIGAGAGYRNRAPAR